MHFSTSVLIAGASLIAGVECSPFSVPKQPSSDHPHFTPGTWPTGFAKPSGFPALPSGHPTGIIPTGGPWGPHAPHPTAFGTGFVKRDSSSKTKSSKSKKSKKTKKSKTKKTKTPKPTAFPTLTATDDGIFPTDGFATGSGTGVFPTAAAFPTGGFEGLSKRADSKSHKSKTPKTKGSKTHHAHGTGFGTGFSRPTGGVWPTGGLKPTGGFAKPTGIVERAADSTGKPTKSHGSKMHKPKGSGGAALPTSGFPRPTGGFAKPTGVVARAADSTGKPTKSQKEHESHKPKGSGGAALPTGGPKPTGGFAMPTAGFKPSKKATKSA